MSSVLRVLLACCLCNVLLALDEDQTEHPDDTKEELYDELLKILYDRKMANEKEEFRSKMNKIIDEEDDIKGLFSGCANIGQNCNALKHCCGTYQCSGLFGGKCTDCVKQGQKCYRDGQCCVGYKCINKPFKGKCGVPKNSN